MLTHASMLANAWVSGGRIGFRIGDRCHSARPFFHVSGSTLSVLSAVQNMVTLVTMDRFEPEEALRLMEAECCTHFSGNDTMALMLLNHPSRLARQLALRAGGENVPPAEVEDILHRHPAIRQAAVVGAPDPRLIEVVAAFVIPNEGAACDPAAVAAWCRNEMAGFKVPRHVRVVEGFEETGMTASSKVQKKPLAAHARKLLGLPA